MSSNFFFPKIVPFVREYVKMWWGQRGHRWQQTRLMRFACWITKTTDTLKICNYCFTTIAMISPTSPQCCYTRTLSLFFMLSLSIHLLLGFVGDRFSRVLRPSLVSQFLETSEDYDVPHGIIFWFPCSFLKPVVRTAPSATGSQAPSVSGTETVRGRLSDSHNSLYLFPNCRFHVHSSVLSFCSQIVCV
jgi:hypothetical protein